MSAFETKGNYTVEKHTKIYVDNQGVAITISPDSELMGVSVRTVSKDDSEYFGKIDVSLDPEIALLVGQAIVDIANDMRNA
jgi:hypothetical protein